MPSDCEIVITRNFNAPRGLVFDAWTKPEHVKRWYGLKRLTLPVCEIDLRVGGAWRYVVHDSESGTDHGFSGEYHEIVRPERLVYNERYEPIPGSDHVVTMTFAEQDGKTTIHWHVKYASVEHRDGHLMSGMEAGMQETLDRLAELLEELSRATS